MFKKGIASIVGASAMAVTLLASCGGSSGAVTIKVWRPVEDKDVMNKIIANFKAAHPDKEYTFIVEDVAEGDVKANYEKNPKEAADVMSLADDNLVQIMKAGQIFAELQGDYLKKVNENNTDWTVDAATIKGKVYGFPQTASNGYFLWYNTDYLSATEASTLEGIFAKAKQLNKKVYYPVNDGAGWYAPGLLSGPDTDLTALHVNDEGKQECKWDQPEYITYAEQVKAWFNDGGYKANHVGTEDTMDTDFLKGDAIAVISGDWKYSTYLEGADGAAGLGDKLAAAKLPTLNSKQMRGFRGAKLVAVNAGSQIINDAMEFALFSTNEQSQTIRFTDRAIAPSNTAAAHSQAVHEHIAVEALIEEQAFSYSQYAAVNGEFWNPAANITKALFNGYDYWGAEGDSATNYIGAQVAQMKA